MIPTDLISTYSDMVYLVGFFVFLLGSSIGSFINVVVDRLIHSQPLTGRSHCDSCKKTLQWQDLVPIVSYVLLHGNCRYCHKKLSLQHPVVEALTGIIFVVTWYIAPLPSLVLYWGIVSCAWIIVLADIRYQLISDYMQIALFVSIFLLKFTLGATFFSLLSDVVNAFLVAFPIWLIYYLSRERAMGQGDVFIAAQIGFLLGAISGYLALYSAFVLGAAVGVFLIVTGKKKMKSAVPFGPFLIAGATVVVLFGSPVLHMIQRLYHF